MHPHFGEWPNGGRWPFKSSSLGGAVWEATPPLGSHAPFGEATPPFGEATPPFIRGRGRAAPFWGVAKWGALAL